MSNFDFDNEPEDQLDVLELVRKYENASNRAVTPFFEEEDYEAIIDYYLQQSRFDVAFEVTNKSIAQYPYSAALLFKKAQVYFNLKQLVQALEALDMAEIYDSSEIDIYMLRAEIFTFQSRYEEAIAILKSIIETADKADLPDIYLQMCDIYEDWEKYVEVYDCLIMCLEIEPTNEEALHRFNYCVEITDRFEECIPFVLQLIDKNPYSKFAWYNLACAYRGLDAYEKSINAFEYVLAIDEEADFVYQDMAELHYKNGKYSKALEVIKDLCNEFEADDEIYFLQGKCYEALGDTKMARYCYRKAVHDNPSLSEVYFRIGETYKQDGQWEQAYKSFQKANELEKEQYDFCLAMAGAASEIGETEVAIDACETAIDIFMNRYEAYFILGKVMAVNGDTETAREVLMKGTEVCKSAIELNYAICAIAFMENKNKEGEVLLRMLLEEDVELYETLFDFNDELNENIFIQRILSAYI